MSTSIDAVGPLPTGVQIGLRVPVILVGILGVVLALVAMRRLGGLAAALAAVGSAVFAADQVLNISWVLVLEAMARDNNTSISDYNGVNNLYILVDIVLFGLGLLLLVFAFFVRRPADRAPVSAGPPLQPYSPWAPPTYQPPAR